MSETIDTLDYRDLLLAAYERRKSDNPVYSYRLMARKLGLHVSHLYRVLHKDLHLTTEKIPQVCDFLGLHGRDLEQFELMVRYARARTERTRNALLCRILDLREPDRRAVAHAQFKALSRWQAPVVRALAISGERDPARMAARIRPKQDTEVVVEILGDLERSGLLQRDKDGHWSSSALHLTTGTAFRSEAVRHYQREVLERASAAIREIPREERDVTSLLVEVDDDARQDIAEMIRECRRQIVQRAKRCDSPSQVLQLAFAAFPVAGNDGASR